MRCPFCKHRGNRVIDSRLAADASTIRRRRVCSACKRRFTTRERVEESAPMVVKKDGRREPFDRAKIIGGLKRACEKRPVSMETIEEIANRIETQAGESGGKEIPSSEVGSAVMNELHRIDQVAYVRFASVYRSFKDIDEFMHELEDLIRVRKETLGALGDTGPRAKRVIAEAASAAQRSRDRRFMAIALGLARSQLGLTSPNPSVGCVLVRAGKIVGRGATAAGGRPHAEVVALAEAGVRARGATAYVSLEPCAHQGKTPPCARALEKAGVARVVIGCVDRYPAVRGRGAAILRRAGIEVVVGVREDECSALNEGFFTRVARGRPFGLLKLAMSLDGRIAAASGDAKWIGWKDRVRWCSMAPRMRRRDRRRRHCARRQSAVDVQVGADAIRSG